MAEVATVKALISCRIECVCDARGCDDQCRPR